MKLRILALGGWVLMCLLGEVAHGFGFAGDTVAGFLNIPWAGSSSNYFTPKYTVVGSAVEYEYREAVTESLLLRVTADISDDQITITRTFTDPTPSYWILESTNWRLTLADLDWAGAEQLPDWQVVTPSPDIILSKTGKNWVQFTLNSQNIYPTGPLDIQETTVIRFESVPEPASAALLAVGTLAFSCRTLKMRRRGR